MAKESNTAAPIVAKLRKDMRRLITKRVQELELNGSSAAKRTGLSTSQISRLVNDYDVFSLDRLAEVADKIGIKVRLTRN